LRYKSVERKANEKYTQEIHLTFPSCFTIAHVLESTLV
jgi:hypothetical protein